MQVYDNCFAYYILQKVCFSALQICISVFLCLNYCNIIKIYSKWFFFHALCCNVFLLIIPQTKLLNALHYIFNSKYAIVSLNNICHLYCNLNIFMAVSALANRKHKIQSYKHFLTRLESVKKAKKKNSILSIIKLLLFICYICLFCNKSLSFSLHF